ncbi:methionyl-tRNA formyltransferase [Magnetospirillum sp. UT-4]|uniref:methionyl-tRNA formyltransferase n=1 Tax=Magnetospirillum sp. UT-4 TaxID=2681467 RepID=UPI001574AC15|nr:methionyl-tRNA formyltransferase [Magnetospirillum sp. UT-4]
MGTPDFSVPILAALMEAGHDVACVYSQPPRPAGRGHKEQPTPVHAFAAARGLEVRTPKSLKGAEAQAEFAALDLDVAVVAAYGLILPKAVLDAPRLGCLNVHASLLPRWRGAAPIQRAIQAGDCETGVTIMQMDEGLDTGAMLLMERLPITATTTAAGLHDALAAMGARMMVDALARLPDLVPVPQPAEGITYAAKLAKDDGRLDWSRPAAELERQVRALNPWPGVWCELAGERLKVLAAEIADGRGAPGTVLDDGLSVACGAGALRPTRVQRPGKAPMSTAEMLRGYAVPRGTVLG